MIIVMARLMRTMSALAVLMMMQIAIMKKVAHADLWTVMILILL